MAVKDASKNKKAKFWVNLYEKRLSHKQRERSKFSVREFVRLSIKKSPMKRFGLKKCLL